jgi:hypothetical protein
MDDAIDPNIYIYKSKIKKEKEKEEQKKMNGGARLVGSRM